MSHRFQRRLARELAPGAIRLRTQLVDGPAAQQILSYASDKPVDLIVIASHGRSGVGKFLFDSVAEKVVRAAPCPVLTLRDQDN